MLIHNGGDVVPRGDLGAVDADDAVARLKAGLRRAFGLSDREVEIAVMIFEGFNNRQIASALNLSDGTARNYISAIYLKLGCDGRADAIARMKELLG